MEKLTVPFDFSVSVGPGLDSFSEFTSYSRFENLTLETGKWGWGGGWGGGEERVIKTEEAVSWVGRAAGLKLRRERKQSTPPPPPGNPPEFKLQ